MNKSLYSGPNRTGICKCGHSWEAHFLETVQNENYYMETSEMYIPQQCQFYEDDGMRHGDSVNEWIMHCSCYVDSSEELIP